MPTARFTVEVQYSHVNGPFKGKDEIVEAIRDDIDTNMSSDVNVDGTEYELEDFTVTEQ